MTRISHSTGALILVLGDLVAYVFSLILTLAIRYGEFPTRGLLATHLQSFSILFTIFLIVSFSAGLYDKQSSFIRSRIQGLLIKVQLVNAAIGIAFFYLAPVSITPKGNLAIYFIISTALLLLWRLVMFPVFRATRLQPAVLVGEGEDIRDLYDEVSENARYGLSFTEALPPQGSVEATVAAISAAVKRANAGVIVADLRNPAVESAMPFLYSLIFSGVHIIDAEKLYEAIFDRIPLSMVGDRWIVEHASNALGGRRIYDTLKRAMDIVASGAIGIVSLIVYPFVWCAIKIEDRGPLFVAQDRVGMNGRRIRILKFRSMNADDGGVYTNGGKTRMKVTRVGRITRLTRIDELPQLWSVFRGDQSLIGPRPELPALVATYEKEIPYYNVRHLIKPGLSGWAQIYHRAHPHHAVAVDDTRDKLSYDLYYIKNRSLMLDIRIAFQTLRAVLSRQGV